MPVCDELLQLDGRKSDSNRLVQGLQFFLSQLDGHLPRHGLWTIGGRLQDVYMGERWAIAVSKADLDGRR